MKPYVDVLGTRYTIEVHKKSEDKYLSDNHIDGYCSEYAKKIVISALDDYEAYTEDEKEKLTKAILRHELVHAHLNESGISDSGLQPPISWAKNEEMVDWIALQFPKMLEAFKWCECL